MSQQPQNENNGFIYVASRRQPFLTYAMYSASSLRDFWEDANITLFTHEEWVTPQVEDLFDNVITGAPNSQRAKLWALSKTPYDKTMYLDADTEIQHEDIKTVFDQFTDDDTDLMITKIRPYNGQISNFPGGDLTDHCGVFMYRSNERTLRFMEEWWELWKRQKSGEWKWDTTLYPEDLREWDQWSYWWLQNKTNYAIKREYFEGYDARWNFHHGYYESEVDGMDSIIVYHRPVPRAMYSERLDQMYQGSEVI